MKRRGDGSAVVAVLGLYAVGFLVVLSFWGFVLYMLWRLVEWVTG